MNFHQHVKGEVQSYKLLEKLGLSKFGELLLWMHQKYIDLDYKNISTQSFLLWILCTEVALEAKLFRGKQLGPGSFQNHMGPGCSLRSNPI